MSNVSIGSGPWFIAGRRPFHRSSARYCSTADVADSRMSVFALASARARMKIGAELRAGRLKIVLPAFEPPPVPIHVVHAEGRRAAARVRAFVDFLAERLRSDTWLT